MPKTVGVSPKVPWQAFITVVVFAAAYFGVDLSAQVALALGVLGGGAAGVTASPGLVVHPGTPEK